MLTRAQRPAMRKGSFEDVTKARRSFNTPAPYRSPRTFKYLFLPPLELGSL